MPKKFVMLIEDDADLFKIYASQLEGDGYAVVGATGARAALMKLRNQAFHCIICDLKLGEGSGEDVITAMRDLRRKELNFSSPIILISSSIIPEIATRLKGKVQAALVKPFAAEDLSQKVKSFESSL